MASRMVRYLVLALLVGTTAACEAWYNKVPSPDQLWYVIPWFDHMVHQRSIHPYESGSVPRNTVAGTVPITGAEGDWAAEFAAGNATTADQLQNPFAGGSDGRAMASGAAVPVLPATLEARGDTLYHTFCAVCHGSTGDGKGPVSLKIGGAPSLLSPRATAFSDGYLYSIIRYGRGNMPRYGDKIYAPVDRWAVVNYIRQLQAQGASASDSVP